MFSVLQGSAETQIRLGGKLYLRSTADFPRNITAKDDYNPTAHTRGTAKNAGGYFYETRRIHVYRITLVPFLCNVDHR